MIPNFYSMGCAHPTGELPCKISGPATQEFPCQPTFSHSYQVESVSSFSGTNLQQSTLSPYMQRFLSKLTIHSSLNPSHPNYIKFEPSPASLADPIRFSSSNESRWSSVANWKTNGTAISSAVRPEMKPNPY